MKIIKIALLFGVLFLVGENSVAQSVKIDSKKSVYTRESAEVPDFKKTFEVNYPVIGGNISKAALEDISRSILYWNAFEMPLQEAIKENFWIDEANYDVSYNKNNILSISLTIDGSAAYPSQSTKYLTFDIRSGKQLAYGDMFDDSKMPQLLKTIQDKMKQKESQLDDEEKEHLAMLRNDEKEFNPAPDDIGFDKLEEFYVSDTGIVFIYNYGYRHVEKALEPDGQILIDYSKLKPFIKSGSLLQTLVH